MAQVIPISKITESLSDQARIVVRVYCALSDINLSKTEELIMAYLITYGINDKTKRDFIIGPLVKNASSLSTMLNKFKRLGLLTKDDAGYHFTPKLDITPQQFIGFKIMLQNV